MSEREFTALARRLSGGGVARRYVERTILELQEHYLDLEDAGLEAGLEPEEAASWARAQLGSDETIARAVLGQAELAAWSRSWPRTAACLGSFALVAHWPAAYCLCRGPSIARWGASVSLALLMTGALLLGLRAMLVI